VKVTATDGNGGTVSDSFDITVQERGPLGVSTEGGISIRPNPASNYFKLAGVPTGLSRVSLISMSGKMVRHYPASEDGVYEVSGLGEGIFFVIIEGDEGRRRAGRIVIRRQ
ncbi:MAG: T9SS type A sorting domain-containing protein, partial [Ekhidna sp.]|nr:T9SS type A sorting domain-containing protein [Ekhidna sp.]